MHHPRFGPSWIYGPYFDPLVSYEKHLVHLFFSKVCTKNTCVHCKHFRSKKNLHDLVHYGVELPKFCTLHGMVHNTGKYLQNGAQGPWGGPDRQTDNITSSANAAGSKNNHFLEATGRSCTLLSWSKLTFRMCSVSKFIDNMDLALLSPFNDSTSQGRNIAWHIRSVSLRLIDHLWDQMEQSTCMSCC